MPGFGPKKVVGMVGNVLDCFRGVGTCICYFLNKTKMGRNVDEDLTSIDPYDVGGVLSIDQNRNEAMYGSGFDAAAILSGSVPAPAEFQSLFAELSRMVDRVERPSTNPGRTSASLERFSTGTDPDLAIVMPNGSVIREDLKEAPSLGISLDRASYETRDSHSSKKTI